MIENRNVQKDLEQLDVILKEQGISRRDAMKMLGLGGAAMMAGATSASAATVAEASSAKGKIVIVGGGLAGMATAARLSSRLSNPDITIIEPNSESVSYQPGNTLIGSGLWTRSDITYQTKDFLPSGVTMVKDTAVEFDPENNKVKTAGGKEISYDFLVVAAGLVCDFGMIKGLEDIGEVHTLDRGEGSKALKVLKGTGACSIYQSDLAVDAWTQMQKMVNEAKSGKKVTCVFPEPHTPFKCGGAQKKMTNLTDYRLNEAGARANADMKFFTKGGKLFGVPMYHDSISRQMKERDVTVNFKHIFKEIDLANKTATFEKYWEEKGAWDEDLEEYEIERKTEKVVTNFDFLHIIPPQKAPKEIGDSAIGSSKGWVPVDKFSLQHVKYKNVFALGDIAAVPLGKTGGSARKQYAVVCDNLIATMEGKEGTAKYNGYTVCPLITTVGAVMLAEFKYNPNGPGAVEAPSFPLDPAQERYIYWLLKYYLLKPMTVYGMLSGKA
jgi:sulfide:quinone oxidoreductase